MLTPPIWLLLSLLSSPVPCGCPALPRSYVFHTLEARWQEASIRLASQWQNPNDVLTVLLIIGGDIVQKALAQLSGGYFVPVAFSFGWVSYSLNALLVVYGDGTLMPSTPYPSTLINTHSGYPRLNYSWILNRVLRGVEASLEPLDAALCVSVYQSKPYKRQTPYDWLWWSGVITMGIQLVIAGIPFAAHGDWSILLVTGLGTSLALVGGALPQWRNEKWGNHLDHKGNTFCLTRGNGFQHVVVIQNSSQGCLHLESLAMPRRTGCSRGCKVAVVLLALLWVFLLINVCGLKQHTWYLLGVGFLGMIQNIFVAAIPRQPHAMGLPLDLVKRIDVGASLLQTFFPGKLREHEEEYWSMKAELVEKRQKQSTPRLQQFDNSISSATSAQTPNIIPSQRTANPARITRPWTYSPVVRERCSSM